MKQRIARFIRRGLEEERHAVDVAADGDEAMLLATTNDYDVILLDILLPRKNGLAVCRDLRAAQCGHPYLDAHGQGQRGRTRWPG